MKYTIELTDNQKKQMDLLCALAHQYIGFNPKLEPVRTTNLEDTEEYQIGYKMGLEDGAKAQNEAQYSKGSEDARQTLLNLLKIPSGEWGNMFDRDSYYVEAIFKHYSINEIVERIKAYEEKKRAEETIECGDEVTILKSGITGIVFAIKGGGYEILSSDAKWNKLLENQIEKTGRNFKTDVTQLLHKLRGENN